MNRDVDRDGLFGMDENVKVALGVVGGCALFLGLMMILLTVESLALRLGLLYFVLPAPALPVVLAVRGRRGGRYRKRLRDSSQKPAWALVALFLAGSIWMLFFFEGPIGAQCGVGSFFYTAAWAAGIWAYTRDGDSH
jgi:hypothetical protein